MKDAITDFVLGVGIRLAVIVGTVAVLSVLIDK